MRLCTFVVCTHRGTLGTCTRFYSTLYLLSFKCECSVNTLKANENKKGLARFAPLHILYHSSTNLWITRSFVYSMLDAIRWLISSLWWRDKFFCNVETGRITRHIFSPKKNTMRTRTKMCRNIWNISYDRLFLKSAPECI